MDVTISNTVSSSYDGDAIKITNGNFSWGDADAKKADKPAEKPDDASYEFTGPDIPDRMTLTDISVTVPKGKLVAVVGSVGSGKTSLVSALIGEIPKITGDVVVNGTIAFVSQQPWIKNSTLRGNILFGSPYDETKYREVIRVCELETDLTILPQGDATEIGER